MPVLDMPLEQLKTYQGSSPCPQDIDQYWEDALAEMNALDPKAEFIRNDLPVKGAECYDLYFTGTKGAHIHAKFLKPKNIQGTTAAVLAFHGLSGSAGCFADYLFHVQQGYCVAALDTRGQGGYSEVSGNAYILPFPRLLCAA